MLKKEDLAKKTLYYIVLYALLLSGFFLMAMGSIIRVYSALGVAPWDVLHTGLANHLPITIGQASIGLGGVLILVSLLLGVRPYIGTILNMIFIGTFMDMIIRWGWFQPVPDSLALRIIFVFCGSVFTAIGSAIYFSTNLKYGPRDSLMMAIRKHSGWGVGVTRTVMEVTVVLIGWSMGGMFGFGTIFYSLTIGWFLQFFIFLVSRIKKASFIKDFKAKYHDGGKNEATNN